MNKIVDILFLFQQNLIIEYRTIYPLKKYTETITNKTEMSEIITSNPIIQQDLKRCRLRSVPFCTSAVFFALAIFYTWLFSFYGLSMYDISKNKTIDIRYDDICENQTTCIVDFNISRTITNPVGLYYKLTNFKQMRREIANSYSLKMLLGEEETKSGLENCQPRLYIEDEENIKNLYVPCGILPQTVFTDTLNLIDEDIFDDSSNSIVLEADIDYKFHNPSEIYKDSSNWLLDNGLFKEGQVNSHFIVWMRQSAFSPFRKLYSISKTGIKEGHHRMSIRNNYDVRSFQGEKHFVIAEVGYFGTQKYGPAVVFGVMSIFFLCAAAILGFLGINRKKPNSKFHPNQLKTIFYKNMH